jgi:predicted dehydrogenase
MALEPLKLGLLGRGPWGKNYVSTIAGLPDLELAWTAGRDWREKLGGVDGVIVATQPSTHAEIATAAVEKGLPVLVEKPLTMDLAQARALLALAERKRALVMVEHTYLFHQGYERVKARAPKLGSLRRLETEGGNKSPRRPDISPLWDYGAHDVAICLDLMGAKPATASARETSPGIWEIDLDFPGGATARLKVGNGFPQRIRRFVAHFEQGTSSFDDAGLNPDRDALPLTRAVAAFASAIRSGSRDLGSLRLGVDVVEVLSGLI